VNKDQPLESAFMANFYSYLFYDLISIEVQKKDAIKTKKYLTLWQTVIPAETIDNPNLLSFMAATLYDNGDKEKSHVVYLLEIERIRNDKDTTYDYYANIALLDDLSNPANKHYFADVSKMADDLEKNLKFLKGE
jgi:hypothetical protein